MTVDEYNKSLLALVAWREERSNGPAGILAVMFVIRNRVKSGHFGTDYSDVIAKHGQFSSISNHNDPQTTAFPDARDPLFLQALQLTDSVYDDSRRDNLTEGATYYADMNSPAYDKGGWFDREIVGQPEKYDRVATVGTTTYFRQKEK